MTLLPGTRFGPYEILSLIGVGGMGQVYKARDTRLDRTVAIKLLPADLAERPDRRRRFETEARAISSLSHPHICPLFDVGEDQGRAFLVMEYLQGETLEDRLTRGPLPARELLRYGSQIADALDHAHRAQIVHRDLKPSNVMLTHSGLKLLDFGLAKRADDEPLAATSTASIDRTLTAEGTLIGTFQYMAPEQLQGRPADSRSDIFAFGVLLYEMATGREAFAGDNQASLIASILTAQPPPISAVRQAAEAEPLPPTFDHIVDRCLAKDPVDRWHSARDIKLELDWAERGGATITPAAVGRKRKVPTYAAWGLGLVAAAIVAAVALVYLRAPAAAEVTRFIITTPPGRTIGVPENRPRVAVSPDGRHLAFVASSDGQIQIWVRSRDSLEARPLAGTEGALAPFWSPDSRFIGFFAPGSGELKKIDASGGPARTICAADTDGGATWASNGTILFTQFRDGIYRVPAEGGSPERVTQVDKTKGEMNHYWPSFLPDGRHFFYMATARQDNERVTPAIYVTSLDSPADVKLIARMHSKMVYSSSGHVLFVEDGVLMAQTFNLRDHRLLGEPRKVADAVAYHKTLGNAGFSVSDNGVLAYQTIEDLHQLVWYDRRGVMIETGWQPQRIGSLRLSPDARQVAADVVQPRTGLSDIWIYDVTRGAPVSFTTDGHAKFPVWSPDGRRMVLRSGRRGAPALMFRTFDGGEEPLVNVSSPLNSEDWSGDGKWIAYTNNTRKTSTDIWLVDLTRDRKPIAFLTTPADEWGARFSPDSNWVAFVSNELGTPEVYVAPRNGGEKTRISVGGGLAPRWRKDGKELFYAASDRRSIMAVRVAFTPAIQVDAPRKLFEMRTRFAAFFGLQDSVYDVTPDGERFLVSVPTRESASSQITIVLNWSALLH